MRLAYSAKSIIIMVAVGMICSATATNYFGTTNSMIHADIMSTPSLTSETTTSVGTYCITADDIYVDDNPNSFVANLTANFTAHAAGKVIDGGVEYYNNINCVGPIHLRCWLLSENSVTGIGREQCTDRPGCSHMERCTSGLSYYPGTSTGKQGVKQSRFMATVNDYIIIKTNKDSNKIVNIFESDFISDSATPGHCSTMAIPDQLDSATGTGKGSFSSLMSRVPPKAYRQRSDATGKYIDEMYLQGQADFTTAGLSPLNSLDPSEAEDKVYMLRNQTFIVKYPLSNIAPGGGYTSGACCFQTDATGRTSASDCTSDNVNSTSSWDAASFAAEKCQNQQAASSSSTYVWANAAVITGLTNRHYTNDVVVTDSGNKRIYVPSTSVTWNSESFIAWTVGDYKYHKRTRKFDADLPTFIGHQSVADIQVNWAADGTLPTNSATSSTPTLGGYTGCLRLNTDYTVFPKTTTNDALRLNAHLYTKSMRNYIKGSTQAVKHPKPVITSYSYPFELKMDMVQSKYLTVSSSTANDLVAIQYKGHTLIDPIGPVTTGHAYDHLTESLIGKGDELTSGVDIYNVATFKLMFEITTANSMVLPVGIQNFYVANGDNCKYYGITNHNDYPFGYDTTQSFSAGKKAYTRVHNVTASNIGGNQLSYTIVQTVYFEIQVVSKCPSTSSYNAGLFATDSDDVRLLFRYADLDLSGTGYTGWNDGEQIKNGLNLMNNRALLDGYDRLIVVEMGGLSAYVPGPEETSTLALATKTYGPKTLKHVRMQLNAADTGITTTTVPIVDLMGYTANSIREDNTSLFQIKAEYPNGVNEVPQSGGDWLAWGIAGQDPDATGASVAAVGKYKFTPLWLVACVRTADSEKKGPPSTTYTFASATPDADSSYCSQTHGEGNQGFGAILYRPTPTSSTAEIRNVFSKWFTTNGDIASHVADYSSAVYGGSMTTEKDVKDVLDNIQLYNHTGDRVYWYTTQDTTKPASDPDFTRVDVLDATLKRTKHRDSLLGAEAGFFFTMPSFTASAQSDVKYVVTYEMGWKVEYNIDGVRRSYIETQSSDGRRSTTEPTSVGSTQHLVQSLPSTLVKTSGAGTGTRSGHYNCPTESGTVVFNADSGAKCVIALLTQSNSSLVQDLRRIERDVHKIESDTSDNGLILFLVTLCSMVLVLVIIGMIFIVMYQRRIHTMTWKLGTMLAKPNTRSESGVNVVSEPESFVRSAKPGGPRRGGLI